MVFQIIADRETLAYISILCHMCHREAGVEAGVTWLPSGGLAPRRQLSSTRKNLLRGNPTSFPPRPPAPSSSQTKPLGSHLPSYFNLELVEGGVYGSLWLMAQSCCCVLILSSLSFFLRVYVCQPIPTQAWRRGLKTGFWVDILSSAPGDPPSQILHRAMGNVQKTFPRTNVANKVQTHRNTNYILAFVQMCFLLTTRL